jgi:hypothetical protein
MIRYIKKEKLTWPSPRKKNPSLSRKIIYIYILCSMPFHLLIIRWNADRHSCEKNGLFLLQKANLQKKPHDTKITRRTKKILLLLQRILLNNFLGGLSQSPLDYDGHFFECLEYFCKNYEKRKKEIIFAFCCPPTISPPLL